MLSRAAALRPLARAVALDHNVARNRRLATYGLHRTMLNMTHLKNGGRLGCSYQRSNFSTSSPVGGVFDFWGKSAASEPLVEKTYEVGTENLIDDAESLPVGQGVDFGQNIDVFAGSPGSSVENDVAQSVADTAPTFADLGLGGNILPHRLFQDILEQLHDTAGLDWCPAIAVLTIVLRTLAVPMYIKIRAFSVRSTNVFPETHRLQQVVMKGAREQNKFVLGKARMEYQEHMKKHKINPMGALLYQLPNGIMFMSMFMALRGMCRAHVPSMVDGGALWFINLTAPDPYMILPVLSCLSMSALIKFGAADAEMGPAAQMSGIRKFMMWMPVVSIPFLLYQPSAMFAFWLVSNTFTIILATVFRLDKVKKFCGVPEYVKHDKSVMDTMSDSMNPMKILADIKKAKTEQEKARKLLQKVENHKKTIEKLKMMQKREREN